MSTFLRTFSITKPLAPAHVVREATNTGVGDFRLIDASASFLALAEWDMVVVNMTDSLSARVVRVLSDTELLLDRHIFSAAGKQYQLLLPARVPIVPGAGQEIIIFNIFARNKIGAGEAYKLFLRKEGLERYRTDPIAETSSSSDKIDINRRLLPTDTEFYVIENATLQNAGYVVEGLDKTLSSIQPQTSQGEGGSQ